MILCLDAGNTRLKWGLWAGSRWQEQGVLDYAALQTLPGQLPARPVRILACNVAGAEVSSRLAMLASALKTPLDWFKSTSACCGVTNGYDNPAQLGADRWAALIGAHHLHRGAAIVVMAGTATTIDFLDSEGKFRGGLILPGLALMRASLARNTAGLPEACGRFQPLPTNTDDAIESGCLMATLGAIERLQALAGRLASAEPTLIVSGGAAEALWPHLPPPKRRVEQLVLEGLAIAATASSSS